MKKVRKICLFLAFILMFSGLSITAGATQSDLAVTSGCHSVDAATTLSEEEKLTLRLRQKLQIKGKGDGKHEK